MVAPNIVSATVRDLKNRYRDAYLISKVTVSYGNLIKIIAVIFACVIVVGTLYMARQAGEAYAAGVLTVAGIVVAGAVGLLFYLAGVIVAAHGQVLQATIDTAVNSSPYLLDADRAEIMSLSWVSSVPTDSKNKAAAINSKDEIGAINSNDKAGAVDSKDETGATVGDVEWKCRCGQINPKKLATCHKCGRATGAII